MATAQNCNGHTHYRTMPNKTQFLFAAILALCATYCFQEISADRFDSNILSLMPRTNDHTQKQTIEDALYAASERQAVVLLSHSDNDVLESARASLSHALKRNGVLIREPTELVSQLARLYQPYSQQLLSASMRHELQTLSAGQLADKALRAIYSPPSILRPQSIADDPFNLSGHWLQSMQQKELQGQLSGNGAIHHKGADWLVLAFELDASPFQPQAQEAVSSAIASLMAQSDYRELRILQSGLVFHASQGALIAKQEISTFGVASLLLVLTLILLAFRSVTALLSMSFVLCSSSLIALTVTLAVFETVNLITLAFGTSLIGVAVDYCFHLLYKRQTLGSIEQARRKIRGGLLLSLASSLLAYGIQLSTPFPGLQQFAVFVMAGLCGAAMAVLWGFSFQPSSTEQGAQAELNPELPALARALAAIASHNPISTLVGCLAATIVSAVALLHFGSSDSLQSLNTSGAELIQQESQAADILGRPSSQRYFLVQGKPEDALQAAEALSAKTAQLEQAFSLRSAADFIPSQQRQRADHKLISSKLYGEHGALPKLCTQIAELCKSQANTKTVAANEYKDDLDVAAIEKLSLGLLFGNDWQLLTPRNELSQQQLVAAQALSEQRSQQQTIRFIDRSRDLSTILSTLRERSALLLLALTVTLCLLAVLLARQKGLSIAISLPCVVLIALASTTGPLTLFHLLAVLLVIGLSLDAAIFYIKLGFQRDTFMASTLSMFSSIAVFGVLSFSAVPVLEQFGRVVFGGLLCAALLIPLIHCAIAEDRREY